MVRSVFVVFAVLCLSCLHAGAASARESAKFESPPTLKASSVLPRAILSSPLYKIDETVRNDGYLNTYVIHSKFGDMKAVSTALLHVRLSEIAAMEKMDQVQGSSAYGTSLVDKGKQTVQGAVNLVTDPLHTVEGAMSGVGKLFMRAHEQLVESSPSKYEDSRFKGVIGYSQVKRDYAKQFGVDPYSTNTALQEKLSALAEAGYAGTITGSALQALVPGGVGIAVSSVSGTAVLGGIDLTVPPAELRMNNRKELKNAGVPESLARVFINNGQFTPTQQTIIVKSLASMKNTRDKADFIEFAAETSDQDLALFRQRMSRMYAGYDQKVAGLKRFVRLERFVGAEREDGVLVLAFPLDYLVCTGANADIIEDLAERARDLPAKGVELWLTGKASPMAKKLIKKLGWKLHEEAGEKLLGTPY